MAYEILGANAPISTDPSDVTRSVELGLRQEHLAMTDKLAQELGLTGVRELVKRKRINYPELSQHEWRVWKTFLPMAYFEGPIFQFEMSGNTGVYMLKDEQTALPVSEFTFNIPPIPVLEAWKEAKERKLFDGFIVRTPEDRRNLDPILVGVKGGGRRMERPQRYFLIARWAEGALLTFEEIEQKARTVWEERSRKLRSGIACICGCGKTLPPELPRIKVVTHYPKPAGGWPPYGPTQALGMLHPDCATRIFGATIPAEP